MELSATELPSNRKFGVFFTFVFAVACGYYFSKNIESIAILFAGLALAFLSASLIKPDTLRPLNYTWMRLGLLLGKVTGPIVLGIIFFVIFTPAGIFMRLIGRDELRLKAQTLDSYWKVRNQESSPANSFKHQF